MRPVYKQVPKTPKTGCYLIWNTAYGNQVRQVWCCLGVLLCFELIPSTWSICARGEEMSHFKTTNTDTFIDIRGKSSHKNLAWVAFDALPILMCKVWRAQAGETLIATLIVWETIFHREERWVAWERAAKKVLIPGRDEGMKGWHDEKNNHCMAATPFWLFTYFILLVGTLLTWFNFCAERNHPDLPTRHHFRPNFRYEHYGEAQEQHMKGRQHQKAVVYQNNLKAEETETVNELRCLSYSCVCVLILACGHMQSCLWKTKHAHMFLKLWVGFNFHLSGHVKSCK